jgi:YHS domain-containing protein
MFQTFQTGVFQMSRYTTKDPVCGTQIEVQTVKWTSKDFGRIFYFCSEECKEIFDKSHPKYSKPLWKNPGGHAPF